MHLLGRQQGCFVWSCLDQLYFLPWHLAPTGRAAEIKVFHTFMKDYTWDIWWDNFGLTLFHTSLNQMIRYDIARWCYKMPSKCTKAVYKTYNRDVYRGKAFACGSSALPNESKREKYSILLMRRKIINSFLSA